MRRLDCTGDCLISAASLTASYYENFYTQAERQAADLKLVNAAMGELELSTLPKTRDQFRALVEAQNLSTTAGQEMFAALLQLAPAFAAVTAAAEDTTQAQQTLLDDVVSKWGDVAKTLRDYAAGLLGGIGGTSLAAARQKFTAVSTSARLGDIDAATQLRDVSEAFRQASLATSSSSTDYIRDPAKIQSAVNRTITTADQQVSIAQKQLDELRNISRILGGVPGFASGGDHAGGWRVVGENGPELEYTGPSTIYPARGGMGGADVGAIVDELRAVRAELAELKANTRSIAMSGHKTERMLDRATNQGEAMRTVAAE
ncbi:MAG: hypothetical protein JWL71_952 [Acidobacteria bacterium]|nr:hypothetical protein [Acidobacteriota bacterium]